MHDVIVIGAGPTGMMLAAELRLRGVEVLVIERDAEPTALVRSLGLHPRSVEILDQRGLLERFLREGRPYPDGARRFAGIEAPPGVGLDSSHAYVLGLPQPVTDRLLAERAVELGAVVRRGIAMTALAQDADAVTIELSDGTRETARWLVGCDGGRSLTRTLSGVAFPGEAAQTEWLLGEFEATMPADELAAIGDETRAAHQGFGIGPVADGRYRAAVPAASVSEDREIAPTFDDFRARLRALAGTDFGAHSPRSLTRFTDATRLAERYRIGRVLLAGDAAHVHPPLGGQGLNLGIQDAFNLGWKLADAVTGRAPTGLIDTYEAERHPVAADVLNLTRVQSVLISPEPGPRAVRRLVTELMGFDDVARTLIERVAGTGIRYELGSDDPLVGTRLRDLPLTDGRLYERMRDGRGQLLDPSRTFTVEGWSDRVGHVVDLRSAILASALLLRPDGYIAWAGDDASGLRTALARWFGAPAA